jgi:NUMOD4 motif/HNH endonuclease
MVQNQVTAEYELWIEIYGYEKEYEVSTLGRVRSIRNNMILKPFPSGAGGYLQVKLSKYGKATTFYLHHLVADHFLEGYERGVEVHHANKIRTDNKLSNLKLMRKSDHLRHHHRIRRLQLAA